MINKEDKIYLDIIDEIGGMVYEFYNMSDRKDLIMVYEMKYDLIYSYIYKEFKDNLNSRSKDMLAEQYKAVRKSGKIVLFIRDEQRQKLKSFII